jgi:hypothetical protein
MSKENDKYVLLVGDKIVVKDPIFDLEAAMEKARETASDHGEGTDVYVAKLIKAVQVKYPAARYIVRDA